MNIHTAQVLKVFRDQHPELNSNEQLAAAYNAGRFRLVEDTWINFTSLQNRLPPGRTGQIRLAFQAAVDAQSDPVTKAEFETYFDAMKNKGLDFGCQKASQLLPSFVPAVITAQECEQFLSWGRVEMYAPVTAEDFATAATLATQDELVQADFNRAQATWQWFCNERVNPWRADPANVPQPTYAEFLAKVQEL